MINGDDETTTAKKTKTKPKGTRVRMAYGPGGGKPRAWTVGPPVLSKTYRLCDCSTEVEPDDAQKLLAGGEWLKGRVFIEDGEPVPPPKAVR